MKGREVQGGAEGKENYEKEARTEKKYLKKRTKKLG